MLMKATLDTEALEPVEAADGLPPLPPDLRPRLTAAVGALLRGVLRRSENPGYAEDIVSEALATAYRRSATYDPRRGAVYPWLLRIAKNKALDFLRRHGELMSERALDERLPDSTACPDGPELLYGPEARPDARTLALRRALKRLRRYDQELLICRFGNALDYEEIERYFNFTVKKGTLRVHVKRAQDRLRREMAKEPVFKELLCQ